MNINFVDKTISVPIADNNSLTNTNCNIVIINYMAIEWTALLTVYVNIGLLSQTVRLTRNCILAFCTLHSILHCNIYVLHGVIILQSLVIYCPIEY